MQEWIDKGAELGWLIDPEAKSRPASGLGTAVVLIGNHSADCASANARHTLEIA
jgi:hypothetical protein